MFHVGFNAFGVSRASESRVSCGFLTGLLENPRDSCGFDWFFCIQGSNESCFVWVLRASLQKSSCFMWLECFFFAPRALSSRVSCGF